MKKQILYGMLGFLSLLGYSREELRTRFHNSFWEMIDSRDRDAALAEVRTPIGLDIRAQTPAEIAVSVAAELIETRAQRHGADA